MIINYFAIIKEIRSFLGNSGLGLVFEKGFSPRTNGKTIYVQKPDVNWSEEELIIWKMAVYHEAGHNEPAMRDCFTLAKDENLDMTSFLGIGMNILDDYRQEKYKLGIYKGRDSILSRGRALFDKKQLKDWPANTNTGELTDDELIGVLHNWSNYARTSWQKDIIGLDVAEAALLRTAQREKYAILCNDYTDKLNAVVTARDEWELLLDIVENVFDRSAEDEQGRANGKDNEPGLAHADGEGRLPTGKDGGGRTESTSGRGSAATARYEDLLAHNHADQAEEKPSYNRLDIDYSTYDGDAGFEIDINPTINDYESGTVDTDYYSNQQHYKDEVLSINTGKGLSNKIRKLLQVKTQTLNVYGQKSGRIASKSIYRAGIKNTGAAQRKVFKKKIQQYDLDVAVTILIDNSGSMGGERMAHAIKSCLLLNEAIASIGVPVEVLGFTDTPRHGVFNIYKTFNKRASTDTLLDRLVAGTDNMSANADGEAILWAYNRLTKQRNKRKLLIVLSDGQPASHRGDADALTKKVTAKIQSSNLVELYGIGIQSDAVERYYKHNAVINHAHELESSILNVVKNYILK